MYFIELLSSCNLSLVNFAVILQGSSFCLDKSFCYLITKHSTSFRFLITTSTCPLFGERNQLIWPKNHLNSQIFLSLLTFRIFYRALSDIFSTTITICSSRQKSGQRCTAQAQWRLSLEEGSNSTLIPQNSL